MTVLLITGAGASRNLGQDGDLMPLMPDWSDALCEALNDREPGLALACHLTPGMEGPQFEENLGLLLRWQQVRHLEERFQGLGGDAPGQFYQRVANARENSKKRLRMMMEAVNMTLYDQFAQHRVDDVRGKEAYGELLEEMGNPELVLATTNYDRAGESALAALGHEIDAGFRAQPLRTPVLEPSGLVSERGSKTPVIHLHGAVGWYEKDGSVVEHHPDQPYNSTLGTPVVLYPDPDKDPTSDAVVSELWLEFNKAIEIAESILVLGHSLNDPALVRALRGASESRPVVISYLGSGGEQTVRTRVPGAIPIEVEFGPQIEAGRTSHSVIRAFREPDLLATAAAARKRSTEPTETSV